jgi:hypothetical protein
VVAWYHGRGGADFTALTKTIDHATEVRAKSGVSAFAGTCPQIKSAALAAVAAPPMPLASVATVYSQALDNYVTAATKCEQASAAGNSSALSAAAADVVASSNTLNRAAAVLIAALSDA